MSSGLLWASGVLCVFVAYLAADIMGFFKRGHEFPVDGRTVVITGGSQGMGLSVARQLSQKGANVVIVARDQTKLESAIKLIEESASKPNAQKFHTLSADLRNAEECDRVIREVTTWNHNAPPDIVWTCAGQSLPSLFIDAPPEHLKGQMDTIYWSAVFTAQAALRSWLAPAASTSTKSDLPRHLIFTCSTLAFVPIVGYSPYSPAKAAMRCLAETLMQEIQLYNGSRRNKSTPGPAADIKIHTIFPTGIQSPGFEYEESIKPDVTKKLEETDKPQASDEVASLSIQGLERGDSMITTTFLGTAMKGTALGGFPRDNIVLDTVMNWVSSLAILFIGPDMKRQVWKWGKETGVHAKKAADGQK